MLHSPFYSQNRSKIYDTNQFYERKPAQTDRLRKVADLKANLTESQQGMMRGLTGMDY